jgi:hypothetical protein
LGIDYFFGDPIGDRMGDPDFDRETWRVKSIKQATESVPKWVPAVKAIYGMHMVTISIHNLSAFFFLL